MKTEIAPELHTRPLPSLDQWLTENGDGTRGEGFEAFRDLLHRQLVQGAPPHLSEDEASFYRMWIGLQIAVVEASNIECQKGREPWQIVQMMPRVLGAIAIYSLASVITDEAPYRSVLKIAVEEFRHGAKISADALEADRESEAPNGA